MDALYVIVGEVIQGKKRGKSLGFPTANVLLSEDIPEGIYASEVVIDEKVYFAATFIGAAETFNEQEKKVESYVLEFTGDLYGKFVTVKLYKKLRENKKFESKEMLIEQIEKDVEAVRNYF